MILRPLTCTIEFNPQNSCIRPTLLFSPFSEGSLRYLPIVIWLENSRSRTQIHVSLIPKLMFLTTNCTKLLPVEDIG